MSEIWISEPELRDLMGAGPAECVLRELGGRSFYVPRAPHWGHPLARYGGLPAMAVLCEAFGGERIALPSGRLGAHKHRVKRLLAEGCTHAEIAARMKVTERYVRMVAAGLSANPKGQRQLTLL